MAKTRIIFWSLFNRWLPNQRRYERRGIVHPALTQRWIRQRFNVWKATAYRSFANQTAENVVYGIGCRYAASQITRQLFSGIAGVTALHSNDEAAIWLKSILEGYEDALVIRLDSDDMYAPTVAEEAMSAPERQYIMWKRGYLRVMSNNRLFVYDARKSGPFFAHRYKADVLINRGTMAEPHHHLIHNRKPFIMDSGRFIVNIHSLNLSSRAGMKGVEREITGKQRVDIFRRFKLI